MKMIETADLWWKNAVVYCASVRTFLDTDGDGIGDLAGMTERIDYLADLGVTCLWLMPVQPSGGVDDGYDITDFYTVDPKYGTLGHFVELVRVARSRGIRVILDFVMNHTSDQHPWFKASRSSTDNEYRDWYVWRSDTPPDTSDLVAFPDKEDSIWEKDDKTGEWYLHNFYRQQPDLNTANPQVRAELTRVMGFWLQLGVDGFRIDAVPFLFARDDVPNPAPDEEAFDPMTTLRHVSAFCAGRSSDTILLGEVNVPRKQQKDFFGGDNGDGLTMQFDFIGMQACWLAFARHDARPIAEALASRPDLDMASQWANFLRNHDELTLDKLSKAEIQEVFDAFAPEEDMQVYGHGIRRRLPSMFEDDPRRIRMAYSLMFSLPGTPVLFYGEEVGMAENLDIPDRYAVRTPMQWSADKNGGFSDAQPRRLARPLPGAPYGPDRVNVSDQRNDPDSLRTFMANLIRRYRQSPEIGWGAVTVLPQEDHALLAHVVHSDRFTMIAVHNLAPTPTSARIDLADLPQHDDADQPLGEVRHLSGLLANDRVDVPESGPLVVDLDGYGYRWLRVVRDGDSRIA